MRIVAGDANHRGLPMDSNVCHSEARCVPRNLSCSSHCKRGEIPHFVRNDSRFIFAASWEYCLFVFQLLFFGNDRQQQIRLPVFFGVKRRLARKKFPWAIDGIIVQEWSATSKFILEV